MELGPTKTCASEGLNQIQCYEAVKAHSSDVQWGRKAPSSRRTPQATDLLLSGAEIIDQRQVIRLSTFPIVASDIFGRTGDHLPS